MAQAVPCQLGARIAKSGRQVFFSVADTVPINGVCSPGIVTSLCGTPVINRSNGNPIQLGPPRYCPLTSQSPLVSYSLECGGVDRLLVVDGGEGYTPGTALADIDNTNTGGSGFAAGDVDVEMGVTGYAVTNPGGGYEQPPTAQIVDQQGVGTGALCFVVLYNNKITKVVVTNPGTGYKQPVIQFSSGAAAGLVACDQDGAITGVFLTNFGKGYPGTPAATVANPPNSSGPRGNVGANAYVVVYGADAANWGAVPGTIRGVYPAAGGLIGCGKGYVQATPPKVTIDAPPAGGVRATATANVSGYVAGIAKVFGGSSYNAPPVVTVAGSTSRPAVIRVKMTGALPSDQFTYSVPAALITASFAGGIGSTPACVNVPLDNWTGRWEGAGGGLPAMSAPRTMRVGVNHGSQPLSIYGGAQTWANKLHGTSGFGVMSGGGVLTNGPDQMPVSWTLPSSTVLVARVYSPSTKNMIDNMSIPSLDGPWSAIYDDVNVNTPNAMCLAIRSGVGNANVVVTPWSLSGSSEPIVIPPSNVTFKGGAITGISLAGLSLGKGWQGAAILALTPTKDFGFCMANVTVANGTPTAVNVVTGGNYPSQPTVYLYGTLVEGTTVSQVVEIDYIPTTTPGTGPSSWTMQVLVNVAQPQGQWNCGNLHVVAPDPRTRQPNLSVDRTNPYAVDPWVLDQLRDGDGATVESIRFMDGTGEYGGQTGYYRPSDLIDGSAIPWSQSRTVVGPTFTVARPFNTDPNSTTYSWYSDRAYGSQHLFSLGQSDGFGNYIPLPPTDMGNFMQNEPWWGVVELCSDVPHNLQTGQCVHFVGTDVIQFNHNGAMRLGGVQLPVVVTSPTSIVISGYVNGGDPSSTSPQIMSGTAQVPVNVTTKLVTPQDASTIPYEYAAGVVSQLPGCSLWLNMPHSCNDECYAAIANKVIPILGPENGVKVEFSNEPWQGDYNFNWSVLFAGLASYLPADANYLGGTIGNYGGPMLMHNMWLGYALATANAHAIFLAEWVKAGLDPGRVQFVYSGQFGYTAVSQSQLQLAFEGNLPIDYVCLAYYAQAPIEPSYTQAVALPGSLIDNEESATVEEICELFRWYHTINPNYWSSYRNVASLCQAYGQPMRATPVFGAISCGYNASGGVVRSVVLGPAANLMQNPVVNFPKPSGAGARAAVARTSLVPTSIGSIAVLSGGKNYSNPQATITGGGGTCQSVSVQSANGVITGIVAVGSQGYTTTDDMVVHVTDPTGTGATFMIYLSPTSLSPTVQIIDGGAGYPDKVNAPVYVSGGGMLQAGIYKLSYTFVDADGVETGIGTSESVAFTQKNRDMQRSSMPTWAPWVRSMNVYLRPTGGQPTLYRSFTLDQYNSTYPAHSSYTLELPLVASNKTSPTSPAVAGGIRRFPKICHYEYAFQNPIPVNQVPFQDMLLHDILMSEAGGDMMEGLMYAAQQGDPRLPDSGSVLSLFFSMYGNVQYPWMWEQAFGTRQVRGDGTGNLMCTPQGGHPGDAHDHIRDNNSPVLNRQFEWMRQTSSGGPSDGWTHEPVAG